VRPQTRCHVITTVCVFVHLKGQREREGERDGDTEWERIFVLLSELGRDEERVTLRPMYSQAFFLVCAFGCHSLRVTMRQREGKLSYSAAYSLPHHTVLSLLISMGSDLRSVSEREKERERGLNEMPFPLLDWKELGFEIFCMPFLTHTLLS
jgi:hypothetical protein